MDALETPKRTRRVPLWIWAAGALLLLFAALLALQATGRIAGYKSFYLPAESMAPTLLKGDRILAEIRPGAPLRRGDIVLFTVRGDTWIKRVAGLPGDRIAFVGGKAVINGQVVAQQPEGAEQVEGFNGRQRAVRLRERFPGEAGSHLIYDMGESMTDDFAEQRVAPGHLFLVGDNRDSSADSRVGAALGGIEQVPVGDVTGRPLVYTWGPSHKFWQRVH